MHSSFAMLEAGFKGLYARIWYSNASSLRALRKAGWSCVAFVFRAFTTTSKSVRVTIPLSNVALLRLMKSVMNPLRKISNR